MFRIFSFILTITEVNAFLTMKCAGGRKETQLDFRNKLAYELVHNALGVDKEITRSLNTERVAESLHRSYISIPPYPKWVNDKRNKVYNQSTST